MTAAYFITGTDTEVGKTTIASGLLNAARHRGQSTAAIKPIASDCQLTTEGLRNSDALRLQAECSLELSYTEVNPIALAPAIAPHLAAAETGQHLSLAQLLPPVQQVLDRRADLTLVEGAGGWRLPLNEPGEYLSDLPKALKMPVILVVGVRLGCINHALLTAEAIQTDGLVLKGWIANQLHPDTERLAAVLRSLETLLPAPCLGQVPWLATASAAQVAHYVKIPL